MIMEIPTSDLKWLYDAGKISIKQLNDYWNEMHDRHIALTRMTKHKPCDCMNVVLELHNLLSIVKLHRMQEQRAWRLGGYSREALPF